MAMSADTYLGLPAVNLPDADGAIPVNLVTWRMPRLALELKQMRILASARSPPRLM